MNFFLASTPTACWTASSMANDNRGVPVPIPIVSPCTFDFDFWFRPRMNRPSRHRNWVSRMLVIEVLDMFNVNEVLWWFSLSISLCSLTTTRGWGWVGDTSSHLFLSFCWDSGIVFLGCSLLKSLLDMLNFNEVLLWFSLGKVQYALWQEVEVELAARCFLSVCGNSGDDHSWCARDFLLKCICR